MPGQVGVELPAVALGPGEVPLQCRAELDDAALFGLDFAHFEVEVVLLGVFAVRPARRTVVLHPLESQIDTRSDRRPGLTFRRQAPSACGRAGPRQAESRISPGVSTPTPSRTSPMA